MESGSPRWRVTVRTPVWRPPTDVYETDDRIVVRVEIAGMREADFSIELDDRFLLIRGVRPDIAERRAYHQMEIRFGEFSIEVELPAPVISGEVKASYENGFLHVTLPKARSQQVHVDDQNEEVGRTVPATQYDTDARIK
ncbi:MAG TPA: Hsp20/alpha crystallin family protein [Anaerolineales bacterium]